MSRLSRYCIFHVSTKLVNYWQNVSGFPGTFVRSLKKNCRLNLQYIQWLFPHGTVLFVWILKGTNTTMTLISLSCNGECFPLVPYVYLSFKEIKVKIFVVPVRSSVLRLHTLHAWVNRRDLVLLSTWGKYVLLGFCCCLFLAHSLHSQSYVAVLPWLLEFPLFYFIRSFHDFL